MSEATHNANLLLTKRSLLEVYLYFALNACGNFCGPMQAVVVETVVPVAVASLHWPMETWCLRCYYQIYS